MAKQTTSQFETEQVLPVRFCFGIPDSHNIRGIFPGSEKKFRMEYTLPDGLKVSLYRQVEFDLRQVCQWYGDMQNLRRDLGEIGIELTGKEHVNWGGELWNFYGSVSYYVANYLLTDNKIGQIKKELEYNDHYDSKKRDGQIFLCSKSNPPDFTNRENRDAPKVRKSWINLDAYVLPFRGGCP